MLNKISEYINDNKFRIILYEDKVNIINYKKIITLENNYISILTSNKKILIKGNNLVLNKLLDSEMLIKGNINSVEVIDA